MSRLDLRGMLRRWRQRRAWRRLPPRGKLLVRYLDPAAVPPEARR